MNNIEFEKLVKDYKIDLFSDYLMHWLITIEIREKQSLEHKLSKSLKGLPIGGSQIKTFGEDIFEQERVLTTSPRCEIQSEIFTTSCKKEFLNNCTRKIREQLTKQLGNDYIISTPKSEIDYEYLTLSCIDEDDIPYLITCLKEETRYFKNKRRKHK